MRIILLFFLTNIFFLTLPGCGPIVHYFGETYPSTETVDIYYDEKDVPREYTVIGQMSKNIGSNSYMESSKSAMIAEAKNRGANGIIFHDIDEHEGEEDYVVVKAKLIVYSQEESQ